MAAFGAFVDIGVHQDGLVHVSELSDRFVRDPREVVKVGDIVRVRVLDVDVARKRISLSMRNREKTGKTSTQAADKCPNPNARPINRLPKSPSGTMAAAFAGLKLGR